LERAVLVLQEEHKKHVQKEARLKKYLAKIKKQGDASPITCLWRAKNRKKTIWQALLRLKMKKK
jgi:hypothetical protein